MTDPSLKVPGTALPRDVEVTVKTLLCSEPLKRDGLRENFPLQAHVRVLSAFLTLAHTSLDIDQNGAEAG